MYSNGTTGQNVGIGFQSLYHFTTGENGNLLTYNTALGANSMLFISKGEFNTAIGGSAMTHFSDPGQPLSGNTAIGYNALAGNIGSNNIAIGKDAGADINGTNPASNSLFIDIDNLGENSLIYGRFNDNYLDFNGNVEIKDTLYLSNDGLKFENDEEVNTAIRVKYGIAANSSVFAAVLIGEIKKFAKEVNDQSIIDAGLVPCDGRAISRTTYSALFDLIGTTYGSGDGSTTFNVPDFRKGIPVGE
jgi:hypothetical protein